MDNRDQRKTQLENAITTASKAIEGQLGNYKDKGKDLLIIGGILVAAFALSRLLIDNKDDETEQVANVNLPEESSMFGSAMKGMITSVLLTVAKNKILAIIQELNQNEESIK